MFIFDCNVLTRSTLTTYHSSHIVLLCVKFLKHYLLVGLCRCVKLILTGFLSYKIEVENCQILGKIPSWTLFGVRTYVIFNASQTARLDPSLFLDQLTLDLLGWKYISL